MRALGLALAGNVAGSVCAERRVAGPEGSGAPSVVRQAVHLLDARLQ